MAEKNFLRIYINANSSKKFDIITRHYADFIGIVDGYTEGLRYQIECDKDSCKREALGDLGVRVQTGGCGDPTQSKAMNRILTKEAIVNCDFSRNELSGLDRADEYIQIAFCLRDMRKDYELFKNQMGVLGGESEIFERYLSGSLTLRGFAEEKGITYESAQQRMHKIRCKLRRQVIGCMEGKFLNLFC